MIQPLKINKKTDNDAKLAQIIKENIPAYEYMSADEVNSMVGKINEMVPAINVSNGGFQGTLSVNEKRVDSGFYIPTESGTFINADNVKVDLSQGINFVTYDGDKWEVAIVPIIADGQIEEGNMGFVSGGTVYQSINKMESKIEPILIKTSQNTKRVMSNRTLVNGKNVSDFVAEMNSTSLSTTIVFENLPLQYNIYCRSHFTIGYNDTLIYSRKPQHSDPLFVTVNFNSQSTNVSIVIEKVSLDDASRLVKEVIINDAGSSKIDDLIKYQKTSKNIFFNYNNSLQQQESNVWISDVVEIKKNKGYISLHEISDTSSIKIEILEQNNSKIETFTHIIELFNGNKRNSTWTPTLIPFESITKIFRVRITNTDPKFMTTQLKSVTVIEVDSFSEELNKFTPKEKIVTKELEASIVEKKISSLISYNYVQIENKSKQANAYVTVYGIKQKLKPLEIKTFKNVKSEIVFKYYIDRSIDKLSFVFSDEKITEDFEGIPAIYDTYNILGYNIIRPFNLPMNLAVLAYKDNNKELWQVTLDEDDPTVVKEEKLLYTFDLPINDVFITANDSLLVATGDQYNLNPIDKNFRLFRSPERDWGKNFTEIETGASSSWLPRMGIDQISSGDNGVIIFGEYTISKPTVGVFRSVDDGVTWSKVMEMKSPSEVRHIHTVKVDYTNMTDVYITTGDAGAQLKWFKSIDRGATFTELDMPKGYLRKVLGMDITSDYIIVVTDAPGFMNYIYKFKKNDLFEFRQVYVTSEVMFGIVRVQNKLFAWTVTQHAGKSTMNQTFKSGLICSDNDGDTWENVFLWKSKYSAGNTGFRYATLPDVNGNFYLRTDRANLSGHVSNHNSILIKALEN